MTSGLAQLALKQTPIDKFLYLSTIRKNNVHLFYRLVTDHIQVSSSLMLRHLVKSNSHTNDFYPGIDPLNLYTSCR